MKKVVVAVIIDTAFRLLITQRPWHASHGGYWEFPGGKVEDGELDSVALVREVDEEVGLQVKGYNFLGTVQSTYQDEPLDLFIYHVHHYEGDAFCREGQLNLRWVSISELEAFQFPKANTAIIELLKQLPFITGK